MNKKLRTQAGFTLAELLIVVAIIGVLVAISIPIFGPRLEGSRESTDVSNLRSAYAAATSEVLAGKDDAGATLADGDNDYYYTKDGTLIQKDTTDAADQAMKGKSTQEDWQGTKLSDDLAEGIIYSGDSGKKKLCVRMNTVNNTVKVTFADNFEAFGNAGPSIGGGGGEDDGDGD